MPLRTSLALTLLCFAALPFAPAQAIEFHHSESPFVPVHNCTCRLNGEEIPLHQRRCIATVQGQRTAECVLEQNVTSWRPTHDECPQALLYTPRG